ncbi:hypothetical protein FWK35_00014268 [Aphis craccivora]|uniref:Uncharacterized protein n=1 Tax=Aphis craccivora TaxID=307492 RepID=A0A6G0YTJ7_APHCR|nr:hypothetical protein FWK35_00014268 [Aphis craccivora]
MYSSTKKSDVWIVSYWVSILIRWVGVYRCVCMRVDNELRRSNSDQSQGGGNQ